MCCNALEDRVKILKHKKASFSKSAVYTMSQIEALSVSCGEVEKSEETKDEEEPLSQIDLSHETFFGPV